MTSRRLSPWHACMGCRKRKNRCGGERPTCAGCRSRQALCVYPPVVAEKSISPQRNSLHNQSQVYDEIQARTPTNELADQSAWGQQPEQIASHRAAPTHDHGPVATSTSWDQTSRSGQVADVLASNMSRDHDDQVVVSTEPASGHDEDPSALNSPAAIDSSGADGYFGDSSTFAFVHQVSRELQNVNGVHLQRGRAGASESVASPEVQYKISAEAGPSNHAGVQSLPDRKLADDLVDSYFDRFHPLYPFMHEGTFRAEYEEMWADADHTGCRLSWFALLNIVFTLGGEFSDMIKPRDLRATVTPFVNRAREIVFTQIHRRGSLELVQALLLLCYYLAGTLEINECCNLAGLLNRAAFSIGLHLNPDVRDIPCIEKEVRKRVWWGCFTVDMTISLRFGRPASMHPGDARNVPYPLAVDDQYIQPQTRHPRQPASQPCTIAGFIHCIGLFQICSDILRKLYSDQVVASRQNNAEHLIPDKDLAELIILDGRLRSWWKSKPAHLDPARDQERNIIRVQQAVLRIRYIQIVILLQRPLLPMLSRNHLDDELLRAIAISGAQTCVDAALQSLSIIQEQYQLMLSKSNIYNMHALFTSTSVLVHVQKMEPEIIALIAPKGLQNISDALECGIGLLRTSSQSSLLAARCITMLNHVRAKLDSRASAPVPGQEHGNSTSHPQEGDWMPGPFADSDLGLDPGMWQFVQSAEIDLEGLDLDMPWYGL